MCPLYLTQTGFLRLSSNPGMALPVCDTTYFPDLLAVCPILHFHKCMTYTLKTDTTVGTPIAENHNQPEN